MIPMIIDIEYHQKIESNFQYQDQLYFNCHFEEFQKMIGYSATQAPGFQDTSTKKYPYNKYHDFRDEDSSGRKYIRQQFNLKQNQPYFLNITHQGSQNTYNKNQESKKKLHKKRKAATLKKYHNKSVGSQRMIKNPSCNQSIIQMNSQRNKKNNTKASREDEAQHQLKHYKKLCLNMRKKNTELEQQLHTCKQQNKKSIIQLNEKVQKINDRYNDKKENIDEHKVQKILSSLKTIKGKLSKKCPQEANHTKFYNFFIDSLGIIFPDGDRNRKFTDLEIQILWKQILQFLITNDFKPDTEIFNSNHLRS